MTDLAQIIADWRENGTPGPWPCWFPSEASDREKADMRLEAAAPDMVARIEALEAENTRLRKALRQIAGHNCILCSAVAWNACRAKKEG